MCAVREQVCTKGAAAEVSVPVGHGADSMYTVSIELLQRVGACVCRVDTFTFTRTCAIMRGAEGRAHKGGAGALLQEPPALRPASAAAEAARLLSEAARGALWITKNRDRAGGR